MKKTPEKPDSLSSLRAEDEEEMDSEVEESVE